MPGNIIAIANQKGGVGKTTTAINTAYYLAEHGKSVLIIDLDPQANTTSGLGFDKHGLERDIYHALYDETITPHVLLETPHGINLLPASPVLAAAEVELVDIAEREHRLRKVIEHLQFDYVFIDCPPSLGLLTVNALAASDHVIIPVQTEYYALEGLGQLLHTIDLVKQGLNPSLGILGVVLTMHTSRTVLSQHVQEEIRKHFPDKAFEGVIPRNIRVAEAPSYGQPLHVYDKRSKGAKAYKKLAKEVERRVEQ